MNHSTRLVLQDTYKMLLEKVEADAPKVLEELRAKMSEPRDEESQSDDPPKLEDMLKDYYINPFNIPKEFILQKKSEK